MLQSNGLQLDFPKILRMLCTAMIDNKERVKAVGLEALAVMNNCVGQTQFLQVRAAEGCCVVTRMQRSWRAATNGRPERFTSVTAIYIVIAGSDELLCWRCSTRSWPAAAEGQPTDGRPSSPSARRCCRPVGSRSRPSRRPSSVSETRTFPS